MPETIGRYQVLEELGRGQMGAVYRARDPQIDRVVAIKVILTDRLSPDEVKVYKERFRREAWECKALMSKRWTGDPATVVSQVIE